MNLGYLTNEVHIHKNDDKKIRWLFGMCGKPMTLFGAVKRGIRCT